MPEDTGQSQVATHIASPWIAGGFSVIPIKPDGTKRPSLQWAAYQRNRMSELEADSWWGGGSDYGVAVVCGAVSGGLEMLELEAEATDGDSLAKIRKEADLVGVGALWDELCLTGYTEWSPSGGLHLLYRISDSTVPGNAKVARMPGGMGPKVLAETRGEGGYVIVAPTGGSCHPSGEPWETTSGVQGQVLSVTWSQREQLHRAIFTALDQMPVAVAPEPRPAIVAIPRSDRLSPADDFNQREPWSNILESQGWTFSHDHGDTMFWCRPGKSPRDGHSATTGSSPTGDRLYVFSTSTGLPTEEPLSKFFVYAHYHHGGSMSRAALDLIRQGFGEQRQDDWEHLPVTAVARPAEQDIVPVQSQGEVPLFDRTETDVGNAERLVAKAKGVYAYDFTDKSWMSYEKESWVPSEREQIMELARQVGQDIVAEGERQLAEATTEAQKKAARRHRAFGMATLSDGRLRAMLKQAASFPGIALQASMMDNVTGKIPTKNALIDLKTGIARPPRAEDYLTRGFGIEYQPDATAPRFTSLMQQLFPSETNRAYVQRALGYALTGRADERVFFLLHGPSGTGKSTLTRLMTLVFGDYGCTASDATFKESQNDSTVSLHELRGKRFVATSELPRDSGLNETLLKRYTGADPITSRTHYQRDLTWQPEGVLFVATNFLPRISGDDDALWRRARVIEMNEVVTGKGEIRGLAQQLFEAEGPGILNWLLAGLKQYEELGLAEPDEAIDAANRYRNDADPVASFLAEELEDGVLVKGVGQTVDVSIVYARYQEFCARNGYKPMGIRRVHARMTTMGYRGDRVGGRRVWLELGLHMDVSRFQLTSR